MRVYAQRLLTRRGWRTDCTVTTRDGAIVEIREGKFDSEASAEVLAPGLIDIHNHGGQGFDASQPDEAHLRAFLEAMLGSGVTDMLMTLAPGEPEATEEALRFAREAMRLQSAGKLRGARIRGVHMEGPFLSPSRPGAMTPELLLTPSAETFEKLYGAYADIIRVMTVAPELPGAIDLAAHLRKRGIRVQAGHSDASFEEAEAAFQSGFSSLCHSFNACRPIHHREPGVVTAALLDENVYCEAICDLVHLHPGAIRLLYHCKGPERMMVVSDSTMPTGLPDGEYRAANHAVLVKDGVKRTPSGALSGGVCYLDQSARNLVRLGIPERDALRMTSDTPARRLGLMGLGELSVGASARMVGFDEALRPRFTVADEELYETR